MKTRRMGMMTALLLTAALFLMLPGLMRTLLARESGRVDASLRPPKVRTVTVWVMNGKEEGIEYDKEALKELSKKANGDIREYRLPHPLLLTYIRLRKETLMKRIRRLCF